MESGNILSSINLLKTIYSLNNNNTELFDNTLDVQEVVEESTQAFLNVIDKNSDVIAFKTARFIGKVVSSFDFSRAAVKISDIFTQIFDHFNWDKTAEALGKGFAKGGVPLIKNADLDSIGEELGNELNTASGKFLKGLKIKQVSKLAANDLAAGADTILDSLKQVVEKRAGELARNLTYETLPYLILATGLLVATPLTLMYFYKKAKHNIGRPNLAIEEKRSTYFSGITNKVWGVWDWIRRNQKLEIEPVYDENTTRRLDKFIRGLKHNGIRQNLLLYGPGGTGKTLIAKKIARDSGMDFVMMSGGDLAQYIARGEHVTELNKLMKSINKCSKPTILFIDEAEGLCRDRSMIMHDGPRLELVNTFLNHTGTQNKKLIIIMATNRKKDLDEAVLNRMDIKIAIRPPAKEERKAIIKLYASSFFKKPDRKKFTPEIIESMADKTEGFTGRILFKLINSIFIEVATSDDKKVTHQIIDTATDDFITQEADSKNKIEGSIAESSIV